MIFDLDDGREFDITNIFLYFKRFNECMIPAIINLILAVIVIILSVIFAVIFLAGDFYSLMYAYPYVSDNMLYSVIATMIPKMLFFMVILGILFSFANVIPLTSYAIIAKGDKRVLKNLFSNSFNMGLKNIKDYILMCLFYIALSFVILILYFIFSIFIGFIASILWPVGIVLFLAEFFGIYVFIIWVSMSCSLLCKKIVEKEIYLKYEQYGSYSNNNFNYGNQYNNYTNDTNVYNENNQDSVHYETNVAENKTTEDNIVDVDKNNNIDIDTSLEKGEFDIEALKRQQENKEM